MSPKVMMRSLKFFTVNLLMVHILETIVVDAGSSTCQCQIYSGDSEYIAEDGTCENCYSCDNSRCECKSASSCSITFTIVGICIGLFATIIIFCYCYQRRRRIERQRNAHPVVIEPAQTNMVVNNTYPQQQNMQMVNGQPIVYVQTQPQQQYIVQPQAPPQ